MAKINRSVDNGFIIGADEAHTIEYNISSGGQKSLIVGPRLLPIQIASGFTTDASSGIILPKLGALLAVYNNANAVGSITISKASASSLAPGVTDAAGNVGVACPPNAWTYLSMSANTYLYSSAATLLCYIVEDQTCITQESGPFINQNVPGTLLPLNS